MRIAALALVGAFALTLAGCTPVGQLTSTPTPKATAVFASDAAALKAAEKAYAAYLVASDEVGGSGGADVAKLRPYVTAAQLKREQKDFAYYVKNQVHSRGTSRVAKYSLESYSNPSAGATVTIYVCVDVSAVRIIDNSGSDVTSNDRPDNVALEVKMVSASSIRSKLLVDGSSEWSGSGVC